MIPDVCMYVCVCVCVCVCTRYPLHTQTMHVLITFLESLKIRVYCRLHLKDFFRKDCKKAFVSVFLIAACTWRHVSLARLCSSLKTTILT